MSLIWKFCVPKKVESWLLKKLNYNMGCRATLIIIIVPRRQRLIHNSSWKQIVLLLQMCDGTSECVWLYAYCYLINKLFHQYWSESLWYHTTVKKSTVFHISNPFKTKYYVITGEACAIDCLPTFLYSFNHIESSEVFKKR